MAKYLVGCDIGTSGTKAIVINEEGSILGSHHVEYPLITPRPGWVEHDPECYWNAFVQTVGLAVSKACIDPRDIRGIGISALSPGCILVDKDLNPLQMCHIWLDRRGVEECSFVREKIGDDKVFQLSANPLDPHSGTIKLLWEKNNRPDLYKKTYKMLNPSNYVTMKLTGKAVTDYSNASLIGIAYDIVNRKWDHTILEEIGLDVDKFPELFPCDEVIGEVTREAAEAAGLAPGIPVVAGTVDCNAAWTANGATEPGDAALVMGTAGALGVVHDKPVFTRNLTTIVHTANSETLYTTLAGTASCGALIRYFRDNFGHMEKFASENLGMDVYDLIMMEASKIAAGSNGLIVLPYFSGERTPLWNPLARGVVFGLSLSHNRAHLIRAMMEGAVYAIYHNFRIMQDNSLYIKYPILASEGGARSAVWRQIVADVLNVPITYMENAKGAPLGDAVNAGVGVGIFKSHSVTKEWITIDEKHIPNGTNHELYKRIFEIYIKLYEDIKGNYELLAKAMS